MFIHSNIIENLRAQILLSGSVGITVTNPKSNGFSFHAIVYFSFHELPELNRILRGGDGVSLVRSITPEGDLTQGNIY